ncbi:hypothetical protein RB6678 [Rhodopirellula baltica SH 1]|uniref:Uncharacterized protein n=1 Tax=Rhodopirellula baltica (strain DSM 10527 / NCIMB 13988 / SH1) TaxID=243090 RepID=Q7UPW8_RHOBA|nr:hypothetical protein RB6678 [Rhodopirellula baltica SH 1]
MLYCVALFITLPSGGSSEARGGLSIGSSAPPSPKFSLNARIPTLPNCVQEGEFNLPPAELVFCLPMSRQGLPNRNRQLDRNQLLDRTDRHDRIVSANRRRISRSISNSEGHLTRIAT